MQLPLSSDFLMFKKAESVNVLIFLKRGQKFYVKLPDLKCQLKCFKILYLEVYQQNTYGSLKAEKSEKCFSKKQRTGANITWTPGRALVMAFWMNGVLYVILLLSVEISLKTWLSFDSIRTHLEQTVLVVKRKHPLLL